MHFNISAIQFILSVSSMFYHSNKSIVRLGQKSSIGARITMQSINQSIINIKHEERKHPIMIKDVYHSLNPPSITSNQSSQRLVSKDPVTNAFPISGPPYSRVFRILHGENLETFFKSPGEIKTIQMQGRHESRGERNKQDGACKEFISSGLKSRGKKEKNTKVNYSAPDKSPVNAVVETRTKCNQ